MSLIINLKLSIVNRGTTTQPLNVWFWPQRSESCHCLPTKLWEGNFFSHVCLSVHRVPHVTITHDALDLTVQGLTPSVEVTSPSISDIWWPWLETCSNLFTWGSHCPGSTPVLTSCGWLLKHVQWVSRWYWNAFLFYFILLKHKIT